MCFILCLSHIQIYQYYVIARKTLWIIFSCRKDILESMTIEQCCMLLNVGPKTTLICWIIIYAWEVYCCFWLIFFGSLPPPPPKKCPKKQSQKIQNSFDDSLHNTIHEMKVWYSLDMSPLRVGADDCCCVPAAATGDVTWFLCASVSKPLSMNRLLCSRSMLPLLQLVAPAILSVFDLLSGELATIW